MIVNITLTSLIPQYIQKLEEAVKAEVEHQTNELLKEAQANCPVRTGKLRDSGHTSMVIPASGIVEGAVIFTAEYAPRIESRRHFLYGAYTRKEQTIVNGIIQAIKRV